MNLGTAPSAYNPSSEAMMRRDIEAAIGKLQSDVSTLTQSSGSGVTSISSTSGDLTITNATTTPALTVVSAPKLTTARTVAMSGDVAWSVSFDGSANVTAGGTIQSNAVTTSKINNSAVTLAKIANASANTRFLGSGSAGSGAAYSEQTITAGSNVTITPGASGITISSTGTSGGGTAPTYRGSTASGPITGTSSVLSLPVGSIAGDLIIYIGVGGNTTNVLSGSAWTLLNQWLGFWNMQIYYKTLTAGDISTGTVTATIGAAFINYAAIFTFASPATIISTGILPLSFNSLTAQMPQYTTLGPTTGKVDTNSSIFYIAVCSCRGVNAAQTITNTGSLVNSGTNANGSAAFYTQSSISTLPIFLTNHGGTATSIGDVVVGVLNP